jgi:hypothetical protein
MKLFNERAISRPKIEEKVRFDGMNEIKFLPIGRGLNELKPIGNVLVLGPPVGGRFGMTVR